MNRGGNLDAADGFTIVEVMIVLAVSSILLISAMALINGRQAKAQFTTSINDAYSQVQQIINETSDGYFPNNQDFTCSGNAGSPDSPVSVVSVAAGTAKQGTNAGCIFLGKALQFGLGPTSPGYATLGVIPIVGNQYQYSNGIKVPSLTVAASAPSALYPIPTDSVARDSLEGTLQIATSNSACSSLGSNIASCYYPVSGGGLAETGMAAFVTGDSAGNITATSTGSNLQSGVPQLSLYAVKGSHKNDAISTASAQIHNIASGVGLDPAKEVLVCLADPGVNESGLLTIGGTSSSSNGGLGVTLQIKEDVTC